MDWKSYPLPEQTKKEFEQEFRAALEANRQNSITLETQVQAFTDAIIAASQSFSYVWADQTEQDNETGMVLNEVGFRQDTFDVYKYSGSSWGTAWYNLLDTNGVLKYLLPSENEFEAEAARNRATYQSDGFIEMGKHHSTIATYPNVNEGIYALNSSGYENEFQIGNINSPAGSSRTNYTKLDLNGYVFDLKYLNTTGTNEYVRFKVPIASNDSTLPNRQDLSGFEVFHEEMTGTGNKNALFPGGRIQNALSTFAGVTLSSTAFTDQDKYSGFWEGDTVTSYALDWDTASAADKIAFLIATDNTYYNGAGNICQALVRGRSIAGLGNKWNNVETNIDDSLEYGASLKYVWPKGKNTTITSDLSDSPTGIFRGFGHANRKTLFPDASLGTFYGDNAGSLLTSAAYKGRIFFTPITLTDRLNQGAYHPRYNRTGTAMCADSAGNPVKFDHPDVIIASIADCFTDANGKRKSGTGSIASASSGHPLGEYYDQVIARDFKDLRNYSTPQAKSWEAMLDGGVNGLLSLEHRAWEGEWKTLYNVTGTLDGKTTNTIWGTTATQLTMSGDSIFGGAQEFGNTTYIDPSVLLVIKGDTKYYLCVRINDNGTDTYISLMPWYGDVTADFTVSNTYRVLVAKRQTFSFAEHCHTDLIGDPAATNYPTPGLYATPNLVDITDNGLLSNLPADVPLYLTNCRNFALSRKIINGGSTGDVKRVLVSKSAGGYQEYTYTDTSESTQYGFETSVNPNEIYINFESSYAGLGYASVAAMETDCHILIQYRTIANRFQIAVNSAYLGEDVSTSKGWNYYGTSTYGYWANLMIDLMQKINVGSDLQSRFVKNYNKNPDKKLNTAAVVAPTHEAFTLAAVSTPAGKIFFQLIVANNRAYIQAIFKEMRYTTAAWQDDEKFQIIDYVKSILDDDSNPVVYGQNRTVLPLPYIIPDKEQ